MTPYGRTLLALRADRGLSQRQLAEWARMSQKALSDVETGRRRRLTPAEFAHVDRVLSLSESEREELTRAARMSSYRIRIPKDASPAVMESAHALGQVLAQMNHAEAKELRRLADQIANRAGSTSSQTPEVQR